MRINCSWSKGLKGLNRPNRILRGIIVFAVLGIFSSCTQTLSVPGSSSSSATAPDYFWQNSDLASALGIDYYVLRNGAGTDHPLTSPNGDQIEDGTLHTVTLVVHYNSDSISIDSMGANSIFSLPSGYSFGTIVMQTDTLPPDSLHKDTVRVVSLPDTVPGSLLILLDSKLDSGAIWLAGNLIGPGIPNSGVPVIGRVLDRDDSLLLPPPPRAGAISSFGQSIRIQYSPIIDSDTINPPIYWIAYYSLHVGPVRIEGYSPDSAYNERAQIVSR